MDSDLSRRTAELFDKALQIDAAKRDEFLSGECGDDKKLFDEVSALLKGDEAAAGIFGGIANDATSLIRSYDVLGKKVGRYRVLEKIGSGGMGEVYLAEDPELDRHVSIKLLPAHFAYDASSRARFAREGKAAARLNHPNIVAVYEVGEYQGVPYIVMEYVEGKPLSLYTGVTRMPVDRIVELAIPLCEGLSAAHTAGVIHRDIKPSNIIVDTKGQPRILDFGLAIFVDGETLTRTGSTLGTVTYMSPEQIEGVQVDARSDLFSLGVVIYELLTDNNPFRRDNIGATMRAITQDQPDLSDTGGFDIPQYLQQIVLKLLEKDPSSRYQSVAEVANDLRQRTAPQWVSDQPPGLPERSGVERKPKVHDRSAKNELDDSSDVSADANDYYRRAQGYFDDTREGLLNAQTMAEKAIDQAPNFAPAHALLGRIHVHNHWHYYDMGESRLESAKGSIDRSLELDSNLSEGHVALGYYYYHGKKQYEKALAIFQKVINLQPNNTDCIRAIASIQSRQGKWVEGEASYRRLIELDPRNVDALMLFGWLLTAVRRFPEALDVIDRGIDLAPNQGRLYRAKVWVYIWWNGDMVAARQVLKESEKRAGKWDELTRLQVQLDLIEGHYQHALDRLTDPPGLESPVSLEAMYFYRLKADVHRFLGQADQVQQCLEAVRTPIEEYCELVPENPTPHLLLGRVYAGLGRSEDALREAKLAIELYPVEEDRIDGLFYEVELVDIYMLLGEHELAIDQVERVLSIPSCWTPMYFSIWHDYILIRDHPRFQVLLEKYRTS